MRFKLSSGQILAEILIVIAIVAVIAGVIGTLFVVSLRSTESGQKRSQATALALESLEALRAIASTDYDPEVTPTCTPGAADCIDPGWLHLFCPRTVAGAVSCPGGTKNSTTAYRTVLTADNCTGTGSGSWDLCTGSETPINLSGDTFTRSIYVQNVCRSTAGAITGITDTGGSSEACTGATGAIDRGTLKATITVSVTGMRDLTLETYVARYRPANTAGQTDWSGTTGCIGCPVTSFGAGIDTATNVDRANAACSPAGTCLRLTQ